MVAGAPATKPSRLVAPDEPIVLAGPPPRFVGRGGEKLAAALEHFGLDLTDQLVLDAGASTGGFTDCCLQAGARRVISVDVGRGQMHQRLLVDPRVEVLERTNVRHLSPGDLGPLVDLVVADLSFISLRTVTEPLLGLVRPGGDLLWLVKPQFEAGRQEASRNKGVIADPDVWHRVLVEVTGTLGDHGAAIMGLMTSPLRGADGNVEFLLHGRTAPATPAETDVEGLITAVVADAIGPQ